MTNWCPNCGRQIEEGEKFCRQCGMPQHLMGEEATTWVLSHLTAPADAQRPTQQVAAGQTSPPGQPTAPAYVPPAYYSPSVPPQYQPVDKPGQAFISLGEWLSRGWRVYKENWLTMSLATLLGGFLSLVTIGIMAGPMLMGLYRMAFRAMRGERPEINDLFKWEGRFLQPFLAFLIFALIHGGLSGLEHTGALLYLLSFAATPLLTVMLGLTMPLLLERRMDVAKAINEVGRLIFTPPNLVMWWIVGLVSAAISIGGVIGCGVGILVTIPWMVSSGAVAYRDVFGIDDPNRTNS